jgi:hypothetical protein
MNRPGPTYGNASALYFPAFESSVGPIEDVRREVVRGYDPPGLEFFTTELVVVFPSFPYPAIRGLSLSPLFLLVFGEDWDIFWLKDFEGVWRPLLDSLDNPWEPRGDPIVFECDFLFDHIRGRTFAMLLEARKMTKVTI